jgi:hypothetical protein
VRSFCLAVNECKHGGVLSSGDDWCERSLQDNVRFDNLTACRLFLAQFYLAEVLSETREQDSELRMQSILSAKRQYTAFLSLCEQFQLLHPVVAGTFQRINSEENIDPSLLRGEKIEQKRQEMALSQKIKRLQAAADSTRHTTSVFFYCKYRMLYMYIQRILNLVVHR